jgi:hypothetical protein
MGKTPIRINSETMHNTMFGKSVWWHNTYWVPKDQIAEVDACAMGQSSQQSSSIPTSHYTIPCTSRQNQAHFHFDEPYYSANSINKK